MNSLDGLKVYELIAQGAFSRDWTPLTQMHLSMAMVYCRLQDGNSFWPRAQTIVKDAPFGSVPRYSQLIFILIQLYHNLMKSLVSNKKQSSKKS